LKAKQIQLFLSFMIKSLLLQTEQFPSSINTIFADQFFNKSKQVG